MKVKQIADILNTVFAEALGDEAFSEDLGNIVSAGQTITSATTFGDNFDNYCRSIIDKVGKTVFVAYSVVLFALLPSFKLNDQLNLFFIQNRT